MLLFRSAFGGVGWEEKLSLRLNSAHPAIAGARVELGGNVMFVFLFRQSMDV